MNFNTILDLAVSTGDQILNVSPIQFSLIGCIFAYIVTAYIPKTLQIFLTPVLQFRAYDNQKPRSYQLGSHSLLDSLYSAHLNGQENFPYFVGAIILGIVCDVDVERLTHLANIVVASRVLYTVSYIIGQIHPLISYQRSLVFSIGFFTTLNMYKMSLDAKNQSFYTMVAN